MCRHVRWGRVGAVGSVCLAPARLAEADGSPFILPRVGLFIWASEAERRGGVSAKPRWSRHTAASGACLWSTRLAKPGPDQSRHTTYGGDRCFRGDAGGKKTQNICAGFLFDPLTTLWLTFKNDLRDNASVARSMHLAERGQRDSWLMLWRTWESRAGN